MSLTTQVIAGALRRPPVHRYGPDRSQVAELWLPDGDGPFPVAVVLHGGFWRAKWGKVITRPLARDLARRGIAAWNVEYRRLGNGGGWPMTFDDVGAGIDALAALGDARLDLSRTGAVGHSAGGQLALWAGGRDDGAVPMRWVVALAAVTNLAVAGAAAQELMGGSAAEVPERYAVADPLRRAPLDVPVLLVHPEDDATVPIRRSREYAAAAGGAAQLLELPSGGHRAVIDPTYDGWIETAGWIADRVGR